RHQPDGDGHRAGAARRAAPARRAPALGYLSRGLEVLAAPDGHRVAWGVHEPGGALVVVGVLGQLGVVDPELVLLGRADPVISRVGRLDHARVGEGAVSVVELLGVDDEPVRPAEY